MRAFVGAPLALTALLVAAPASAGELDLVGAWHVLVHYRDRGSTHPERERWDDRVWVFEREGRRLRWKEYPIVVFGNETGRFERRSTGQYARVQHHWEPSASQRAEIQRGLRVNSRGAKEKTLRGSDADGWTSRRGASAASALVITYTELWAIEGLPDHPVFTRSEFMGGAQTDTLEGITRYATTEVSADGNVLAGTYDRDGSRHGTFRMTRSRPVRSLEARDPERPRSELLLTEARRGVAEELAAQGISLAPEVLDEISEEAAGLISAGASPDEVRARIASRIRERAESAP